MLSLSAPVLGSLCLALLVGCGRNTVEETGATVFSIRNDLDDTVVATFRPAPATQKPVYIAPHLLVDIAEFSSSSPQAKPATYLQAVEIHRKSDSALLVRQDPVQDSAWKMERPDSARPELIRFLLTLP